MPKLIVIAVVVAAGIALLVSACGGGDDEGDSTTGSGSDDTITVQAKNVKFEPDSLIISTDMMVTMTLENLDGQEHDLQVDGLDVEVSSGGATGDEHGGGGAQGDNGDVLAIHTGANETSSIVFMAMEKGTYEFHCTITGHKEAGMVGTLVIE